MDLDDENSPMPTLKRSSQTNLLSNKAPASDDDEVLYSLASECETLFTELDKTMMNGSPPTLHKLCTEFQQRFAIWAAQLGVFASPSQCLDTRLRKSPDLQDLTARHLDLLRRCLRQWQEVVSHPPEGKDGPSGLQANLEAIDETLSRLTALGVTIRQPSTARVNEKARKLAQGEDADIMRQLCMQAIRTIYPHAHEALQDRLVQSMLHIWGRMKYLQSRNESSSTRRPRVSQLASISETPSSKALPNASRGAPATSLPILSKVPPASSVAASDLSSVDNKRIMNRNKPPDQASTNIAKTMSVRVKHGSYPQLPDEHVCKWCLQSTKGMSDTMWRRHVDRDLRPYTCLWDDCHDTKQSSYATFTQWFQHMQNHDRRWYQKLYPQLKWFCALCDIDHVYQTQQALYDHLEENHSVGFSKSLLEGISRQGKIEQQRDWNECLLCSYEAEESNVKGYGAGFKRQRSGPGGDCSKQARTSLAMVNPGHHDSSRADQNMSCDSDSVSSSDSDSRSTPKKDNSARHEGRSLAMGQHIWNHLQMLMLLTLRFHDLKLETGQVEEYCASSGSMEVNQKEASASSDSDKHSVSDMDVDVTDTDVSFAMEIPEDNHQNHDSTVPDCDAQISVPTLFDSQTADDDKFMQGIIESGAFRLDPLKLQDEELRVASGRLRLGAYYMHRGRLRAAETVLGQVVDTRQRLLGPEHPDTLISMAKLASIYRGQGRLEEAESLYLQVLDTRRLKLGEGNRDTLISIANLASIYRDQGRLEEAESLYLQVLETGRLNPEEDHPNTLITMANLASMYRHLGRLEEAESLEVKVMETIQRLQNWINPDPRGEGHIGIHRRGDQLYLDAGQIHDIRKGDKFNVYALNASLEAEPLASVEVESVELQTATLAILADARWSPKPAIEDHQRLRAVPQPAQLSPIPMSRTCSSPSSPAQQHSLFSADEENDEHVPDIGMAVSHAPDSGFHVENDPRGPHQSYQVIERTGHGVYIRGSLIDVVHGSLAADSPYWATILVFQFILYPQQRGRRISEANIELRFDAKDPHHFFPEVDAVSFDGRHALLPSSQSESMTKSAEGTLDAGATVKWEKTVSRETTDVTAIIGSKFVLDNRPPDRVAKWTLLENATLQTGVPASVQVAVRLRRMDEEVFSCLPKLTCQTGLRTKMATFFGRVPEDEPVLLRPSKKSTGKLMVYNTEELGKVDLQTLSDVTFSSTLQGM